jgi:hypothetical protein
MTNPISVIVPTTDNSQLKRLEASLNQFLEGFELIPIYSSTSFFDAWKKGIKKAKNEIVLLTHQDTQYYDIPELDFRDYDMAGVAGTTVLHPSQAWWFSQERLYGGILSGAIYHEKHDKEHFSKFGLYKHVVVLDGVCLITKKSLLKDIIPDIDWGKWDFYDHIISLEYIMRGLKLKTIPIDLVHQSAGGEKRDTFYTDMDKFEKEYLNRVWRV